MVGGSGGSGASAVVAALAVAAGSSVIVDLDVLGGGIELSLGIESVPGARWSGLHAEGGRIDPAALQAGLPRWAQTPVLSCDRREIDPAAVPSVLAAAGELGTTVVDLGRADTAARRSALERCGLVVLVARGSVPGVAGARAMRVAIEAGVERPVRWRLVCAEGVVSSKRVGHVVGIADAVPLPTDRALAAAADHGVDGRLLRRSTVDLAEALLAAAAEPASAA